MDRLFSRSFVVPVFLIILIAILITTCAKLEKANTEIARLGALVMEDENRYPELIIRHENQERWIDTTYTYAK